MTDAEERAVAALAWMASQYLSAGDELDNQSMNAGERAMELLAGYGFVCLLHGGRRLGVWTEAGKAFLDAH